MGITSETQKEEIRQRVPLEELVADYNVQLLPSGGRFKALCPFHREKTPSFWIDPERQFYKCFGCNEAGDVYSFVQQIEGVSFPEALEMLARRAGVVLEKISGRDAQRGPRVVELYDAGDAAAAYYHRVLLEDPRAQEAREYLRRRRIDEAMWTHFQLGFSPADGSSLGHALAGRFSDSVLERAGLVRSREGRPGTYDYFRGRLMFPIADAQRRVIGFGARTLGDDVPKYLNTAKTEIFDKSQVLYGLPLAKRGIRTRGEIGIVEGYTDVIALHQAGLDWFVASLGTAFTQDNAKQLFRVAPRVRMVFDGDAAGQDALERSLDLLIAEELDIRIYTVVTGKDPCDAVLELGAEEFRSRLESGSESLFDFKWRVAVQAADDTSVAKARGIDECLRLATKIPNVVNRQLVLRSLSERAGVPERDLQRRFRELSGRERPRRVVAAEEEAPVPGAQLSELASAVVSSLFARPSVAAEMWSVVPREIFSSVHRESSVAGASIVEAIDRLVAAGSFSAERLASEIQQQLGRRWVFQVMGQSIDDVGEKPAEEHENQWTLCLRDIRRFEVRRRVEELDRLIQHAAEEGSDDRVRSLRRERMELTKSLKRRAFAL